MFALKAIHRAGFWCGLSAASIMSPSISAASDVEMWSYSYAVSQGLDSAFPLPQPPVRFLSGALHYEDKSVIVMAESGVVNDQSLMILGVAYGTNVLVQISRAPDKAKELTCEGSGVDMDHAIKVSDVPSGLTEVDAALLCAYAIHGAGRWRSAQLLRKGELFFSVSEYRSPANSIERVYVDVTRWATKTITEFQ